MAAAEDLRKILAQATTVDGLGIPSSLVTDLIYRILFTEGDVSVGRMLEITHLHAQIVDELLSNMQHDHLVEVVKAASCESATSIG